MNTSYFEERFIDVCDVLMGDESVGGATRFEGSHLERQSKESTRKGQDNNNNDDQNTEHQVHQ